MKKTSELNNLSVNELKEKISVLQTKLDSQQVEINDAKQTLQQASEYNSKLAYCTRLFAETHLTTEEKTTIAQEFDRALSNEQVEKIYNKYYKQVRPDGIEIPDDAVWSPGFIRDLETYFCHYKGYNPFTIIDDSLQAIRTQFMIEDEIGSADSPNKVDQLRERWESNRMLALKGIDDIVSTVNDFMKK